MVPFWAIISESLFISQVSWRFKANQTEHFISWTNLISHGKAWVSTVFKCMKSPPYFRVRTSQQQLPLTSANLIPGARIDLFPRPFSRILRESIFTIFVSICRSSFMEPVHLVATLPSVSITAPLEHAHNRKIKTQFAICILFWLSLFLRQE